MNGEISRVEFVVFVDTDRRSLSGPYYLAIYCVLYAAAAGELLDT